MRKSEIILFLKIWGCHLLLYYLIFGFLITLPNLRWRLDILWALIVFPFTGMIGLLDQFVAFPIIPITIMLLIVKFSKNTIFNSYLIAVFTCYVLKIILQYFFFSSDEKIIHEHLIGRRLGMLAC